MKKILYLILESSEATSEAYESIKNSGFNGTLIESASLSHALDYAYQERHFFSLSAYESSKNKEESTVALFIVDNEKINILKDTIRTHTDNFAKVKGAMFSIDLIDYEGTI